MTASTRNARSALSLLGDGLAAIGDPELLQHFETVAECLEGLAARVDTFEAAKQVLTIDDAAAIPFGGVDAETLQECAINWNAPFGEEELDAIAAQIGSE